MQKALHGAVHSLLKRKWRSEELSAEELVERWLRSARATFLRRVSRNRECDRFPRWWEGDTSGGSCTLPLPESVWPLFSFSGRLAPERGNVVFACALDGWGFTLPQLARLLAPTLKVRWPRLFLLETRARVLLMVLSFKWVSFFSTVSN